jgi:hypothetical protein
MGIFENPFFSWQGQVERLTNVGNTLYAAVTGQGVKSNTGVAAVDQVLSTAASNPFVTAGVIATAVNPSGAVALGKTVISASKPVVSAVGTEFGKLSTGAKIFTAVAVPMSVMTVAKSSTLQSSLINAPSKINTFTSNVANVIDNPSLSSAKQLLKDNPVLTSAVVLAGAATVGGGLGLLANTVATGLNTQSTNKNTTPADIQIPKGANPQEYMASWIAQQKAETNKYDVKIAEVQQKAQEESNKAAVEIAKLQTNSINTPSSPLAPVVATEPPIKPTPKKVVKKKKKPTPKKKKPKKKKKKAKSIKRKKKKR